MTPSRLLPLAAALATMLACAPAGAQSLQQLYESARANDAPWQSARAQYDANLFRADQATAGILPTANLSASATRSALDINVPVADRTFGTQSALLSASQPLYRPANWATYKQGRLQVDLAQAQLTAASQDLIIRLSQAYFDVLAAQDTLSVVRAQKAAVAEQLASAKRNFEVGTSTITDTREAQARYDLTLSQEIAAENDLRVKRLALDVVVGGRDTQPLPLALPMEVPAPEPANPEAWVEQAENANPGILQARTTVDIATLETEKARAGHKPTVDLTASYGNQRNVDGTLTTAISNRVNTGTAGVTFNLPLFAGFATQNRLRETLALEERARSDLENARRTAAQATRAAYFGVVSGQGQVKALEAAEASSQSSLDANRLGYQVGVRINIDVLNAQTQLYQTKRDLALARYNVILGHLKLRQANGTLQASDLDRLAILITK
ncbi:MULTISPECIES: TolC family outer membrane protein [Ramlibacter]|uniref:TolC family outer membrane protein n=1 Tax=Ramlibacter pinisoli TaxID=2682844 RepID=A0A6N8IRJ1_9BURK|nr:MULTISPECIES: TolC family outer membrane protein [Ramlibacter]MBA2964502.1 TolC family outer membrane protein [Ramlibacter sp. CGMCC 1.13660]MVQ29468.1 TolC family outer membrane protein [Ramlibacter pinisoli]